METFKLPRDHLQHRCPLSKIEQLIIYDYIHIYIYVYIWYIYIWIYSVPKIECQGAAAANGVQSPGTSRSHRSRTPCVAQTICPFDPIYRWLSYVKMRFSRAMLKYQTAIKMGVHGSQVTTNMANPSSPHVNVFSPWLLAWNPHSFMVNPHNLHQTLILKSLMKSLMKSPHEITMKSLIKSPWNHHEIPMKSPWNPLWNHHEITMKSPWNPLWNPLWNHHEITMKSPWNHHEIPYEITMKSPWNPHEITMKSLMKSPWNSSLAFEEWWRPPNIHRPPAHWAPIDLLMPGVQSGEAEAGSRSEIKKIRYYVYPVYIYIYI